MPHNNLFISNFGSILFTSTGTTLNASGESKSVIGQIFLQAGSGSKTISAGGGGSLLWWPESVTFANATSRINVGIQDVNTSTGLEDGTFDVSAELVGGTDVISAGLQSIVMESGSKTINHGDIVAIVVEMTVRGGVDSVNVTNELPSLFSGGGVPYGTQDVGTLSKTSACLLTRIIFDDGSLGWIFGMVSIPNTAVTTITFNSSSTPDEYCSAFTPNENFYINGIGLFLGSIAAGDDFEMLVYESPSSSPNPIVTLTPSSAVTGATGAFGSSVFYVCTKTLLRAGIEYGVAIRPTTVNDILMSYRDYGTFEDFKASLPFGTSTKLLARTDNTGNFSEVDTSQFAYTLLSLAGPASGGLKLVGSGGLVG